ncbi:MAG TPA: sodium-dependent transporter [Marinagarivorans sp.]
MQTKSMHGIWSNRWTFILAATGSAVGLGNIWKFPYIAGENGGGAFVLVYLLCIALIGIPIMIGEVMLGKKGRANPMNAVGSIAVEANAPEGWKHIGLMGMLAGVFIMSFYSVVAGWSLHYFVTSALGNYAATDAQTAGAAFSGLLASPATLLSWHTVFSAMTFAVVAAGVSKGLGSVAKFMMPFLLISLVVLLFYGVVAGDFVASLAFLFGFNFASLSIDAVLIALGHAFFTLSLGMGAIMAYGAYMPDKACVGKTVLTIGSLDTMIALMAGLAIFPIVFANPSIEAGSGPGLLFVSLPIAFGNMPLGGLFGTLFFALVSVAAWSSSVSLIEPSVAWLMENKHWKRVKACAFITAIAWFLGLASVLSFNLLADFKPIWLLHFTPFEFLDFLTAQIMLPLGGVLIALFVAWVLPSSMVDRELGTMSVTARNSLLFLLKYISPLLVILVMGLKLYETFFASGA